MECARVASVPIVADGGIRMPGDIAKSVVLGADMVMVGGMLSGRSRLTPHVTLAHEPKSLRIADVLLYV
jgi:GMP reductase